MLSKWDGQRRIKRDEVYKRLPIKRKEIMLGHLAMYTFERGEYFFRTHVAENQIGQYIQNLSDASTDPEALLVDSRAVLKAIESQHGLLTERATDIYSFSHLTFHEYFTAKNTLETSDPDAQKAKLNQLAQHITEKRWREVFLLVVERMENAEHLLTVMLQQVNLVMMGDKDLQRFLNWVYERATSVSASYKPVAVRAFYLTFYPNRTSYALPPTSATPSTKPSPDNALDPDLSSALALDHTLDHTLALALDHAHVLAHVLAHALANAHAHALDPELKRVLQVLKDQISGTLEENKEQFKQWWETQGTAWVAKLRATMVEYRNIGHDWQFSSKQRDKLSQYHTANFLLADCLKRGYLTSEARQRIENGMLLPTGQAEDLRLL